LRKICTLGDIMETLTLSIPSWVNKEEAENELLNNLKMKTQLKMEYYRSKMLPFEKKYNNSFEDFKYRYNSKTDESYEEWDDLIEWEASFTLFKEWEQRFMEFAECCKK
jgi:hypothetical protein